ncbi:MAG: hypothetical protein KDA87_08780 [Planctomycetales bacterium]|nr:hypothetical protein [Planctomycetales bacterium]
MNQTRLRLATAMIVLANCVSPSLAESSVWSRTKLAFAKAAAKCTLAEIKSDCRTCVHDWVGEDAPDYGLKLKDRIDPRGNLVVFIHGFNSHPNHMRLLIQDAQQVGLACGVFYYPNDQAIEHSAVSLSHELKRIAQYHPRVSVSLVTHSMGSLVARAAVEHKDLDPANVNQLIMLMPPNHGSNLAKLAYGVDILEFCSKREDAEDVAVVYRAILDGLAEATGDLRPGSAFLKTLNARPRNPNVNYSIFAGSHSVLPQASLELIQHTLNTGGKRCSWFRCADKTWNGTLDRLPEFVDRQGDGVVSVESAKLAGVTDFQRFDVDHNQVLSDNESAACRELRLLITQRLTAR